MVSTLFSLCATQFQDYRTNCADSLQSWRPRLETVDARVTEANVEMQSLDLLAITFYTLVLFGCWNCFGSTHPQWKFYSRTFRAMRGWNESYHVFQFVFTWQTKLFNRRFRFNWAPFSSSSPFWAQTLSSLHDLHANSVPLPFFVTIPNFRVLVWFEVKKNRNLCRKRVQLPAASHRVSQWGPRLPWIGIIRGLWFPLFFLTKNRSEH